MVPFHLVLILIQLFVGVSHNPNWGFGLFLAGMFSWTLAEYVLHRWLFHWEHKNPLIKAFHFAMHGYHHLQPKDTNRLYMPPVPTLLFLSVFWVLFSMFFGMGVWFFLAGFELGYLIYSSIHFLVHTRKAPKYFTWLWHHHLIHHYRQPERAYGVSSRLWDRIFRTMPPNK
jgi:sterol desaturase/sphingolipid hydroxylase (fatty acid hydroxylase superfamily)